MMILHIFVADKFVQPFISYVNDTFDPKTHQYFVINKKNKFSFTPSSNLIVRTKMNLKTFIELWAQFRKADKVILHGLFWNSIVLLLALNAKDLKKCFWGIWGGDLYKYYDRNNGLKLKLWHQVRKFVISRLGHFITYLPEDYHLAQEWYGAKGKLHECITYLSNVYSPIEHIEAEKTSSKKSILIGNSATAANRHEDAFKKLLKFKGQIKLIVPLSYGNEKYGKKIVELGQEMYGDDFMPLTTFMPIRDYYKLLAEVDTVVFNHDRQQGMGNIIQVLGLGKKLFLDTSTPQYKLFQRQGVQVFDVNNIDLEPLNQKIKQANQEKIARYFSKDNLKNQLTRIFETTL